MKRLLLLRHGKSDWDTEYGRDHERPLAERGEHAARLMGRFLTAVGAAPGLIVSSSAVRAASTARLAHEAGGWSCDLRIEPALYDAGPLSVVEVVRAVEDDVDSLLLTGHEPTFSGVAGGLIGSADIRFPTAGLFCAEFPVQRWEAVEMGRGMLLWFVTPKLLTAAGMAGE
jgi:phosphohistidine phosphatase